MSLTELKQNFLNYCEKFDDIIFERTKFPYGSEKWNELTSELTIIDKQRKQYSEDFKNGIQEFFKDKTDEEKISVLIKVAENAFPSFTFIGNKDHIISVQKKLGTEIPEYKILLDGSIHYFNGVKYSDFPWNLNNKIYTGCWIL